MRPRSSISSSGHRCYRLVCTLCVVLGTVYETAGKGAHPPATLCPVTIALRERERHPEQLSLPCHCLSAISLWHPRASELRCLWPHVWLSGNSTPSPATETVLQQRRRQDTLPIQHVSRPRHPRHRPVAICPRKNHSASPRRQRQARMQNDLVKCVGLVLYLISFSQTRQTTGRISADQYGAARTGTQYVPGNMMMPSRSPQHDRHARCERIHTHVFFISVFNDFAVRVHPAFIRLIRVRITGPTDTDA
jgi:hypothetical protein